MLRRPASLASSLLLAALAGACQPVEGVVYTDPTRPEAQTWSAADLNPGRELDQLLLALVGGATPTFACEAAARLPGLVDGVRRHGPELEDPVMEWEDQMIELERATSLLRDALVDRCDGGEEIHVMAFAGSARDALEPLLD